MNIVYHTVLSFGAVWIQINFLSLVSTQSTNYLSVSGSEPFYVPYQSVFNIQEY